MKTTTLTLEQVSAASVAWNNILSKNEFPFTLAWQIEDILEAIQKPAQRFETARKKLLDTYGTPKENSDGQLYTVHNIPAFTEELNKLADTKVSLEFEPVAYEDLKDIKELTLNPTDLKILKQYFIVRNKNKPNEKKEAA